MRASFLPYLIDPATGEELALEAAKEEAGDVREGFLVSKSHRYPIVRGVPRFAGYQDDANYAKSFGYQWNKWSLVQFESHNKGRPMEGHTRGMWERIVGTSQEMQGQVIADIGCGPGRFIEVAREKGARVIGIDYSDAVEAAAENFKHNEGVLICQADALRLPIKPGSLDGIFSIGVLHHTANPRQGFSEMAKAAKTGGWIALSVYSEGGYYGNFIVTNYRRIFKALWPIFKHYPPLIYTYVIVYSTRPFFKLRRLWSLVSPILGYFPVMQLRDIRWSVLDTFDSVTPSNQFGFTLYQVFGWFKEEGLHNIEPSNWGGASVHAIK